MAPMENIEILLDDLRKNEWHITAFQFGFKDKSILYCLKTLEIYS